MALGTLLSDRVLREQLGAKAHVRSGEFSWRQSAEAMRTVLESVHRGHYISGVVQVEEACRPRTAGPVHRGYDGQG